MENKFDWTDRSLAISMCIGQSGGKEDHCIVPLFENLEEEGIYEDDYPDINDAFNKLKLKWCAQKWGYYGHASDMELVKTRLHSWETVEDSEFWKLHIFKELAIDPEFYSRPFDESPEENHFVNWFAADCYRGIIYSKDFGYSDCEDCGRTICQQNPSNGWHSQMHIIEGYGCVCNKCYEEKTLKDGINDEFNGEQIPGQFYNESEILGAGWEKVEDSILAGSGYSGYKDPNCAIGIIKKWIDAGKKVLVNYESMAIGGLGGYISIYIKEA
jgi:hypothetical protein